MEPDASAAAGSGTAVTGPDTESFAAAGIDPEPVSAAADTGFGNCMPASPAERLAVDAAAACTAGCGALGAAMAAPASGAAMAFRYRASTPSWSAT